MQELNCTGIWWRPESPSDRVAGTLHFSEEAGINLSLTGVLGEATLSLENKTLPTILGAVWDCPLGTAVTMKNCVVTSFQIGSAQIAREEYDARQLFVGAHLATPQDYSFTKASIALSGLPSWADKLSGLSYGPPGTGATDRHTVEMKWAQPEPISGELPGARFVLGAGAEMSFRRRQYSITENVRLNIHCNEPRSPEDLNTKYVYPLQNLMTLATDHANALVEFSVNRPDSRDEIRVLRSRVFHDAEVAAELLPHQMLFLLSDIHDRVDDVIRRWIDVSQRFESVCNAYFGAQYQTDLFVDTKFLVVFQALVNYQRTRQGTDTACKRPADSQLTDMLIELVHDHASIVGPLFANNLAAAVTEWMDQRNYVVHRDTTFGDTPTYGERLYWLTQKLMFLMKACFLTELGFSGEQQLKLFQRNQLYAHLQNLAGGS